MAAVAMSPVPDLKVNSHVDFITATNGTRKAISTGILPTKGATKTVPLIDLGSAFSEGGKGMDKVVKEVRQAAHEIGFFTIKNHNVPQQVIDNAQEALRSYFALPHEVKMKYDYHKDLEPGKFPARGYVPTGSTKRKDLNEAFFVGSDHPDEVELYGNNRYPQELSSFKEAINTYNSHLTELSRKLNEIFALALNLPIDYFKQFNKADAFILRLNFYPAQKPTDDTLGIKAHCDFSTYTILCQDDVAALQVLNKKDEWIQVEPEKGHFVINTADFLERWTNDYFKSTAHRVVNLSGRERTSMAFFVYCDHETVLKPLPEYVTEENPDKYPPVRAYDLLKARWSIF